MRLAFTVVPLPLMASTSVVHFDVEVRMDWPTRTVWSRIVWLRLRWRFRRRDRSYTARPVVGAEPAWWNEFERAFWSHIQSGAASSNPPPHTSAPAD